MTLVLVRVCRLCGYAHAWLHCSGMSSVVAHLHDLAETLLTAVFMTDTDANPPQGGFHLVYPRRRCLFYLIFIDLFLYSRPFSFSSLPRLSTAGDLPHTWNSCGGPDGWGSVPNCVLPLSTLGILCPGGSSSPLWNPSLFLDSFISLI